MLTGFQLKAARGVTKVTATDLSQLLKINRFTIAKLEKTYNTDFIKCHTATLLALELYFKENNILFPDTHSVVLKLDNLSSSTKRILTIFQLRAARAALGLSLSQLSEYTKISVSSLSNLEQGIVHDYVKSNFIDTKVLKEFFEGNKLSFPDNFTVRINE